jgi:exopolyphosphatase / guanosine-5'-triphosphate,3'-diphosphate pyrophosphatase
VLCACIDIGSNTTRLLVAGTQDGRLHEVLQHRAYTRLGAPGPVPPGKVAAVAAAVAAQARLARECGCARLRAVGTAALRDAVNRDELVRAIEREAGVEVDVLSGEHEARLAFAGATRTLSHLPLGEVGVVDVGGGSTEVVVGTLAGGVAWSASLRVGSGLLADRHLRSDPASPAELDRARDEVARVFRDLGAPRPAAAYAVGGSAGSLGRMVGPVLDHETLERGVALLTSVGAEELAARHGLDVERARILPAGMLVLREAAAALGTPLRIGRGGLREGVVLEELAAVRSAVPPADVRDRRAAGG